MTGSALIEAAAEELAAVIGAILDTPATSTPADGTPFARWVARLVLTGPINGTLTMAFDEPTAATLARQVMALDDAPPEAAIADTLLEVCGQAAATLAQRPGMQGLRVVDTHIETAPPATAPMVFVIDVGDRFSGKIAVWADASPTAGARDAAPAQAHGSPAPPNLEVILDIDLPLSVRFGETEMTLQALANLAPGSVIDLGRSPDDPVDVLVNGRLVARGEVVVVSGNYGVRITEVISAADRLRTFAA